MKLDRIFLELESMFKLNLTQYTINQSKIFELDQRFIEEHKHLYSYIFIETEQDYKYAKHLYEMHFFLLVAFALSHFFHLQLLYIKKMHLSFQFP